MRRKCMLLFLCPCGLRPRAVRRPRAGAQVPRPSRPGGQHQGQRGCGADEHAPRRGHLPAACPPRPGHGPRCRGRGAHAGDACASPPRLGELIVLEFFKLMEGPACSSRLCFLEEKASTLLPCRLASCKTKTAPARCQGSSGVFLRNQLVRDKFHLPPFQKASRRAAHC